MSLSHFDAILPVPPSLFPLAEVLHDNHTLEHLDLSGNRLGPEGAALLVGGMGHTANPVRGKPIVLVVSPSDVGPQGKPRGRPSSSGHEDLSVKMRAPPFQPLLHCDSLKCFLLP